MKIFKNNRNLFVVATIAVVNALGYGIIIPILYSYSHKFGLSDFQNGLLFSLFSICQFISTPIIGRLSDKYGRRPLLLISITGTAISFFMAAFAQNAIFLFFARALDGLTAGNVPVASAVISDTTTEKERARGFGIIGASFGFGFVFGPAISAVTVGISAALPFIIAGIISTFAVFITYFALEETNKHIGQVAKSKLFDFHKLWHALFDKSIRITLLIVLFYFLAFSLLIYAWQPFALKIIGLSASRIAMLFTLFGILGLITQLVLLHRFTKIFGLKQTFSSALILVGIAFLGIFFTKSFFLLIIFSILLGLSNGFISPLAQTILSKETDAKSQGTILGISASYMSIGQIFGPILGGVLATSISIPFPFLVGALLCFLCFILSFWNLPKDVKKESAF